MNKSVYLPLCLSLFVLRPVMAQSSAELQKHDKEIQSLIQKTNSLDGKLTLLAKQLDDQKQQLVYYKGALDFVTATTKTEVNQIEFAIKSAKGSKTDRTITIEGILTNNNATTRSLIGMSCEFIDPKGNIYKDFIAYFGGNSSSSFSVDNVPTKIPIRFTIVFSNIAENIPLIKQLAPSISFSDEVGSDIKQVIFQNLEVTWE